jgi:hypothetical protein
VVGRYEFGGGMAAGFKPRLKYASGALRASAKACGFKWKGRFVVPSLRTIKRFSS